MRRKRKKKQMKFIILTSLSLLFILTVGYAAFSTNLNITAKGNILNTGMTTKELKEKYCNQTSGDGLYKDTYEEGRCIYKGSNPNNYITFNDESWRILAIEADGTLKIMKTISLGNLAWDSSNSNNWIKPATLNTYLNNDYYNTLSGEVKSQIQEHTWAVGPITYHNADLAAQIQSENSATWTGNIGLMTASEFLRANTNKEQCGNYSLNNTNKATCKTTNYIVPTSGYLWTISSSANDASYVFYVDSIGSLGFNNANFTSLGVLPAVYLTSDIHLDGEGTQSNPYKIVS